MSYLVRAGPCILWALAASLWLATSAGVVVTLSPAIYVVLGKTESTLAALQTIYMLAVTVPFAIAPIALTDWLTQGALLRRWDAPGDSDQHGASDGKPPNYL